MNPKKFALALLPLFSSQAFASASMPALCDTAINYAAQTLDLNLSDGSFSDVNDPASITLKKDFTTYPISNVKLIDDCMGTPVNPIWCQVAGGDPVVYQADVAEVTPAQNGIPAQTEAIATVTVTYNRGGCRVDQVERK
jgi:hypothetical protein